MDWEVERTKLLPRSGVGVVSPWLVIAPPGNPAIRVDLRGLDRVALQTDDDESDDAPDVEDFDAKAEDGDPRCNVILVCGDLEVALYISDGPEAVDRIVREAEPLTRESAGDDVAVDLSHLLFVGNDPVLQLGECIQVGAVKFRISEVREYALRGANIPLPGGRLLQAAMALLVVAASERDAAPST